MKKYFVLFIIIALVFIGCSSVMNDVKTQSYTDDLGRIVELPLSIDKISPSGHPSQILLFTLAPDKMVGWARTPSKEQANYIDDKYMSLPEFGAFYGKKGNLNMEALIAAGPQVVIDFGEKKDGIEEDLNRLQKKIGIPVIFVEGDIKTMGNAYRKLGVLLDKKERGEDLANYCEAIIDDVETKSKLVKDKKRIYYGEGDQGFKAIAAGNIHGRVIEIIGAENIAVIDKTAGSGGNLIDGEQLLNWQPDLMIFNAPAYNYAKNNAVFTSLNAPMYQVPDALYNWMGRPPSINQLMGLYWLGYIVYPEIYNDDLIEITKTYYKTMFNYEMSENEVETLLFKTSTQ